MSTVRLNRGSGIFFVDVLRIEVAEGGGVDVVGCVGVHYNSMFF